MEILGKSLKRSKYGIEESVYLIRFYHSGKIYMSSTLYKSFGLTEKEGFLIVIDEASIYLLVTDNEQAFDFRNEKGSFIFISSVMARKVMSHLGQENEKIIWVKSDIIKELKFPKLKFRICYTLTLVQ